jgi:hypothetical protein
MCFGGGSSPPTPKAPPVPPSEYEGNAAARGDKQRMLAMSKNSGFDATNVTMNSLQDQAAPVAKPVLGA